MLEIFFIISIARTFSRIATQRGRSSYWAGLGVGLWFAGEVMGASIASVLGIEGFSIYGLALLAGGVGALTAYLVVTALPLRGARVLGP